MRYIKFILIKKICKNSLFLQTSNLTYQLIESLVRNTNLKIEKAISSVLPLQNRKQEIEMRDLHNRKEKLAQYQNFYLQF